MMSGLMLSIILHKSVMCATIEFKFTLNTLRGFNVLDVRLGFFCEEGRLAAPGATGNEACTGSQGLLNASE